jgi:hypothetical protein
MRSDIAMAVGRIQEALDLLPDEDSRKKTLATVMENRCPRCFDHDPQRQFRCCYDSHARRVHPVTAIASSPRRSPRPAISLVLPRSVHRGHR